MAIKSVESCGIRSNVSFKSIRKDLNTVRELQNGSAPISDNGRENIQSALNRLAIYSGAYEIGQMLDIASGLQYGISKNSEMSDEVDASFGDINKSEQGIWYDKLRETIEFAMSREKNSDAREALDKKFKEVFSDKKSLTPAQAQILQLRKDINGVLDEKINVDDEESITTVATAKKLLDYFIISPDISETQKQGCLEKMKYFLSDDYKINPQLKDKKVQALAEMLNDLTIKTPESKELLIKDVSQRQSGICAAISVCRKALAYEDKVRYMDIVLNELDDTDFMEVYDITDLGSGKKVKADKPKIDYTDALRKNYRILDASAHIWMQLAGTAGKGNINLEEYFAFDKDHYEVFRDTKWYPKAPDVSESAQMMLRYSIKTREQIEEIEKLEAARKKYSEQAKNTIAVQSENEGKYKNKFMTYLTSLIPSLSSEEAYKTVNETIDFSLGRAKDGTYNFHPQMPEEYREEKLSEFILSKIPKATDEEKANLQKEIKNIRLLVESCKECEDEINAVKSSSTPKSNYRLYKNLFLFAAAHRLGIEAQLDDKDSMSQFERNCHLPPRQVQIAQDLAAKITQTNDKNRQKQLFNDYNQIAGIIPSKLDEILTLMTSQSTPEIIIEYLNQIEMSIKSGDKNYLKAFSETNSIKNSKEAAFKLINMHKKQMQGNPTFEQIETAIRAIGFDSRADFAQTIFNTFILYIAQNGITDDEVKRIESALGEPIDTAFDIMTKSIEDAKKQSSEIEKRNNILSERDKILKKCEKDGFILSRATLDALEDKFDTIYDGIVQNEKIKDLKEREKKDNDLYLSFTKEEKEVFNFILNKKAQIKKYTNITYKTLNQILEENLKEQYGRIGKVLGHFWLPEDGSSGLYSNQTQRIMEQMFGRPYYIEYDAEKAAQVISEGNGSGISSTSVYDKDYAMHAQYVKGITKEIISSHSGEKKKPERILWHDNSWGRCEHESSWKVGNRRYTDYGNGYGWKTGYIVNDDLTTGTPVGILNSARGFSEKYQENFPLFNNMILPGNSSEMKSDLLDIFVHMYEMDNIDSDIEELEKAVKNGQKINFEAMEVLDENAYRYAQRLRDKIKKDIKTQADYDALKDNDPIKINLEKLALYRALPSKQLKVDLYGASTRQEFEEVKKKVFDEQSEIFDTFFNKTPDSFDFIIRRCLEKYSDIEEEVNKVLPKPLTPEEHDKLFEDILAIGDEEMIPDGSLDSLTEMIVKQTNKVISQKFPDKDEAQKVSQIFERFIRETVENDIKIKSLDNYLINNAPNAKLIIDTVDNYFNPKNDDELIAILQKLQNLDNDSYEKQVKSINGEDFVSVQSPYEFVKQIQAEHYELELDFDEMVVSSLITDSVKSGESSYRQLFVRLSDLDVNRYIKRFQEQMFVKYKVRPAFPKLKVYSEEELSEAADRFISQMNECFKGFESDNHILDMIDLFEGISSDMQGMKAFKDENTAADTPSTITLTDEERNHLYAQFEKLSSYGVEFMDFKTLQTSSGKILKLLSAKKPNVKRIKSEFQKIETCMNQYSTEDTGFRTKVDERKKGIRESINVLKNTFVEASILPRYRNKINKAIKEYLYVFNTGDSESIQAETEHLKSLIMESHISLEPVEILKSYVKALENPNTSEYILTVLKENLKEAMKVAQLNKIEFKLVKSANIGIATKIRQNMNIQEVNPQEKSKSKEAKREATLLSLTKILGDKTTNYSTLNLFLTQTGLNEDCVLSLINYFKPETRLQLTEASSQRVILETQYLGELTGFTDSFFKDNKMKFPDFNSAVEQFSKYITNQYKDMSSEKQDFAKRYIDLLHTSQIPPNLSPDLNSTYLLYACNTCLNHFGTEIDADIEEMEYFKEDALNEVQIINAIDVDEKSEAGQRRKAFVETEVPPLMQKIEDKMNEAYKAVTELRKKYYDREE